MKKVRKMTLLVMVAAVFSLGILGCKSSGKKDADHPTTEHPEGDRPKGDHPKH